MDSDLRDLTSHFANWPVQEYGFPEIYFGSECKLVKILRGRACFSFGLAAACIPATVTIKSGTEYSISLGLEAYGLSLEVGTTHTQEQEVAYTIGECDSVNPVVCYPDSTIEIFECDKYVTFFHWKTTETLFRPGGRGTLYGNYVKNDPQCNCTKETAQHRAAQDSATVAMAAPIRNAHVMQTVDFRLVPGDNASAKDIVEEAASKIEALAALAGPAPGGGSTAVGVADRDGRIRWIGGLDSGAMAGFTVLSSDAGARLRRGFRVGKAMPSLPILAAGPCVRKPELRVRCQALGPDGQPINPPPPAGEVAVHSGRATTLYAQVELSNVPSGSRGIVDIELANPPTGCPRSVVREQFSVD